MSNSFDIYNKISQKIIDKIKNAPQSCGVYRYFDEDGRVLYIGKAKNLSKRLNSYLRKDVDPRISKMLRLSQSIDWIICDNEVKALLTEALQVRDMQPRYNILLKDDKSFLEIFFSKYHPFPGIFFRRINSARRGVFNKISNKKQEVKIDNPILINDNNKGEKGNKIKYNDYYSKGKEYSFGPFLNMTIVKKIIDLIQKTFLIRDCKDSVFSIHKNMKRPCLQYYIKRCSAPCANFIIKEEYQDSVSDAIAFCSGKTTKVIKDIEKKMLKASEDMKYELAQSYKDQIQAISDMSITGNSAKLGHGNIDFISIKVSGNTLCFYVRLIRNNSEVGNIDLFARIENEDIDFSQDIPNMIVQFYQNKDTPSKIIISNRVDELLCRVTEKALKEQKRKKITVQSGPRTQKEEVEVKKTEISAKYCLSGKILKKDSDSKKMHEEIANLFYLNTVPFRIEVFDNSHLFSSFPVGGMIVVTPNGFEKSEYRSYSFEDQDIRTDDDYAMMNSMIKRRLTKLSKQIEDNSSESNKLPDLLIIDGGLGQLRAVKKAMDEVGMYVSVVAMAKGVERNAGKEIYFLSDERSFALEEGSSVALYLQKIRDEAHRFAISSHRRKRHSSIGRSKLDEIEGIGEKRKIALLSHFGSLERIKEASLEDIAKVNGFSRKVAEKVYLYLHK